MFIWRETFCAKGTFEGFPRQKHFWQFLSYQNYVVGWDARLSISGDPCAITNYCMNSYLVLQVTMQQYASYKLVSRLFASFLEADWWRLLWDWLALSSDWLREVLVWSLLSCIGQVIAHDSSVCSSMSFHVEGEMVRPGRISFKSKSTGIIFWENSNLSSAENPHFETKSFNKGSEWRMKKAIKPAELPRTQMAFEWFLAWKKAMKWVNIKDHTSLRGPYCIEIISIPKFTKNLWSLSLSKKVLKINQIHYFRMNVETLVCCLGVVNWKELSPDNWFPATYTIFKLSNLKQDNRFPNAQSHNLFSLQKSLPCRKIKSANFRESSTNNFLSWDKDTNNKRKTSESCTLVFAIGSGQKQQQQKMSTTTTRGNPVKHVPVCLR